jgi:hypothetical protein
MLSEQTQNGQSTAALMLEPVRTSVAPDSTTPFFADGKDVHIADATIATGPGACLPQPGCRPDWVATTSRLVQKRIGIQHGTKL